MRLLTDRRIVPLYSFALLLLLLAAALFFQGERGGPAPTPTPTTSNLRYVPRTATPQATALPDQCAYTGTYQMQPGSTLAAAETLASPDGRYMVERAAGQLALHQPGGEDITLAEQVVPTFGLEQVARWSPDSNWLGFIAGSTLYSRPPSLELVVMRPDGGDRHVITRLNTPREWRGWSPDGAHLDVYSAGRLSGDTDAEAGVGSSLDVWSVEGERVYRHSVIYVAETSWSPEGGYYAYRWNEPVDESHHVTLVDVDGGDEVTFELPGPVYETALAWSPEGRNLALSYRIMRLAGERHVGLLLADGTMVMPTVTVTDDTYNSEPLDVMWATEDRIVYYGGTLMEDEASYDVWMHDTVEGEPQIVAHDVPRPPFFSPAGTGLALYSDRGGTTTINLLDTAGAISGLLVANADDAGNPHWSPDGSRVAAVWATGADEDRRVVLTWANANGNDKKTLADDFEDVRHLAWLDGGSTLVYVARREGISSVEMVDTQTGTIQVLLGDLEAVKGLVSDNDRVTFWWRALDGAAGRDTYDAVGERIMRLSWAGLLDDAPQLFPGPDGEAVAVKTGRVDDDPWAYAETLTLAYRDGRPARIVASGLSGLGHPSWSPDGRLLAFTQSVNRGPVILTIVDAAGDEVWRLENLPRVEEMGWVPCE